MSRARASDRRCPASLLTEGFHAISCGENNTRLPPAMPDRLMYNPQLFEEESYAKERNHFYLARGVVIRTSRLSAEGGWRDHDGRKRRRGHPRRRIRIDDRPAGHLRPVDAQRHHDGRG